MYCTNCANEVSEKAVGCPKCGQSPRAEKKFCYNCGTGINEKQVMCTQCGVSLSVKSRKETNKTTAAILALVIGGVGAHKFYYGSWGWGILSILLCWTWIPMIVAAVQGILFLTMDEEKYNLIYNLEEPRPFKW